MAGRIKKTPIRRIKKSASNGALLFLPLIVFSVFLIPWGPVAVHQHILAWRRSRSAQRTGVLLDADMKVITQDAYLGKTVDIRGVVDYFEGEYQIKVFSARNITVHD